MGQRLLDDHGRELRGAAHQARGQVVVEQLDLVLQQRGVDDVFENALGERRHLQQIPFLLGEVLGHHIDETRDHAGAKRTPK